MIKLEIEMKFLKIKMLNIVEMKMLNMVVKREGSVIIGSDLIFLFKCFSLSILDPVRVFSMAFTLFIFVVNLALIFVNASSFLTFTVFTFLFLFLLSLLRFLFSLLKFCVLYWQWFSLLSLSLFESCLWWRLWLSLSLLLFGRWFSPGEVFRLWISFTVVAVLKEHIGGDRPRDQSHNWVFIELL